MITTRSLINADRPKRDALTSLAKQKRCLSKRYEDLLMEHMCVDGKYYKIELTRL